MAAEGSCDPESSDHVVIRNNKLGAHDDNVAIKSGRDADGRRVNVPTQNVVIYGGHKISNVDNLVFSNVKTNGNLVTR